MRVLRSGSTGPAVQLLQLALVRAGYGPLETDGIFGGATRAALIRFQRQAGLAADGVAGRETHRALFPWYAGYVTHTVRQGDTLFALAGRYGVPLSSVTAANPGVDPAALRPGQTLTVPLPFDVVPTDIAYSSELVAYAVRGLGARYPFISVGDIGRSVMGRPLWRMTMGFGENRVLYNASHHANEWITTPVLLKFAEDLAKAYVSGGELLGRSAAEIMQYATLYIVPALDPDGIDLVTGELSGGSYYEYARSIAADYPRFPFPDGWKANIRGVDLNLQYPAGWEQARENKFAAGIVSPAPADYVGSAPLTAPESRALYDFTLSADPALTLSYHTQGQVIYWRFRDYEPENALAIARLFSTVSGYEVAEVPFESGFAGYKDWFVQDFDRPGYTIEAGLGVNPLPISDFDGIYRRNLGILTLGALVT